MSRFSHIEIPSRVNSRSTRLAKSISDYSAVTPDKNHKWSLEQQVTLVLLVRAYQNNWSEKWRIFNSYIADELALPHTFSKGALRSMRSEFEKKLSGPFGNWTSTRQALETRALSLGIDLKSLDHIEVPQPLSRPQSASNPRMPSQSAPQLRTPSESHVGHLITGLPTPKSTGRRRRQWVLPKLGFRAFDISKQGINLPTKFRAGRFINGDVPAPPPPYSLLYRDDARKHIERVHEGATPFISTTSSLLRALSYSYRALYPSSIAIIDLHKAGRVGEYDDERNPFIQHVYSLNPKPKDSYTGRGEFLIYGEIKEEHILSVSTLDHFLNNVPRLPNNDDPFGLQNLKSSNPLRNVRKLIKDNALHMKFSTGHVVGELLQALKLPRQYLDDGASVIVRDWAFKKDRDWRKNETFKKGVLEGYVSGRVNHVPGPDLPRLLTSLKEAVRGCNEEHNSLEEPSEDDFEGLCSSPDTLMSGNFSDYEIIEEPISTRFVQDLHEAVKSTNSVNVQESYLDVVTDLEGILDITPNTRPSMERTSFTGCGERLVPYSDTEDDIMTENDGMDVAFVDDEM